MNPIILVLVALGLVFLFARVASSTGAQSSTAAYIKAQYGELAGKYAIRYGIPSATILGVIWQESAGDPNAKGSIGERGLMQLTQGALADVNSRYNVGIGWDSLYAPDANIHAGTAYLAICRLAFSGNLQKAIQAYNVGMTKVAREAEAGLGYYNSVQAKSAQF